MTGKIKVGGVHKNLADVKVKQAGAWKTIAKGWQKNNGVWTVIYQKSSIKDLVNGWYDFRSLTNIYANEAGTLGPIDQGPVKRAKDLSGNGNDLIITDASAKPGAKCIYDANGGWIEVTKDNIFTTALSTTEKAINILPCNVGVHEIPQSGAVKLHPQAYGKFRLGVVIIPKPGLTAAQKTQLQQYIDQVKQSWSPYKLMDMSSYFAGETVIPDVTGWNMSKVIQLNSMFASCATFNQNIQGWDVGYAINTSNMFSGCTVFNQNLSSWNVSRVVTFNSMFSNCKAFNQPIGTWDMGEATQIENMFSGCSAFNQNLNTWNTSKVINMSGVFKECTIYNQPLNNWNTINVTRMDNMFYMASAFDQDISSWIVTKALTQPASFNVGTQMASKPAFQPKWGV